MDSLAPICALLWADASFKAASPGGIMEIFLAENATLPATTCQIVGGSSAVTLEGSGPQSLRVQFDCHANNPTDAAAARAALRKKLEGYRGLLADGTYLQDAQIVQPLDYYDFGARRFRRGIEFYLFFNFSS